MSDELEEEVPNNLPPPVPFNRDSIGIPSTESSERNTIPDQNQLQLKLTAIDNVIDEILAVESPVNTSRKKGMPLSPLRSVSPEPIMKEVKETDALRSSPPGKRSSKEDLTPSRRQNLCYFFKAPLEVHYRQNSVLSRTKRKNQSLQGMLPFTSSKFERKAALSPLPRSNSPSLSPKFPENLSLSPSSSMEVTNEIEKGKELLDKQQPLSEEKSLIKAPSQTRTIEPLTEEMKKLVICFHSLVKLFRRRKGEKKKKQKRKRKKKRRPSLMQTVRENQSLIHLLL